MRYLLTCLLITAMHLMTPDRIFSQSAGPAVVFQNGFNANFNCRFEISPHNNFLIGYNDVGEYVLWDLHSSRQVRKFVAFQTDARKLYYFPYGCMSDDESYMLIPDGVSGRYQLFDIKANTIPVVYRPVREDEFYTHAFFIKGQGKVLFISQTWNENTSCRLVMYDIQGRKIHEWEMKLPPIIANKDMEVLFTTVFKVLKSVANVRVAGADEDCRHIYLSTLSGQVIQIDLDPLSDDNSSFRNFIKLPTGELASASSIQTYQGKVLIRYGEDYRREGGTIIKSHKIAVVSQSGTLERTVEANMAFVEDGYRSNAMACIPPTGSHRLHVYLQAAMLGANDFQITARDVLTDRELFTYRKGMPFFWNRTDPYLAGQLNGGLVVDISDDGSRMVECTRDLLIHDIEHRTLLNEIAPTKGNIKLCAPLFLDSTTLLIPKVSNDAFVLNLGSGEVNRLQGLVTCNDTARNGANISYEFFNNALMGLGTLAFTEDRQQIATVSHVPSTICDAQPVKKIEVRDAASRRLQKTYSFTDSGFTYSFHLVPTATPSFLVNHQLLRFYPEGRYKTIDLMIVRKKDTFYAAKPQYLPQTGTIFSLMATRSKPGKSQLLFAHYDTAGRLLRSYTYHRKKSRAEFRSFVDEAVLSPDRTKLLFTLYDGFMGIFNIPQNRITSHYQHGKTMSIRIAGIYSGVPALTAVFTDDRHFITCGVNGVVSWWEEGQQEPVQIVNQEPLLMYSASISPDGRYLAGVSMDKTIRLIDLKDGSTPVTFAALSHENYALITDGGYYMSNKKSSNDLWFFYNGKTYEFSQFDLRLNRPDRVMERLSYVSPVQLSLLRAAHEKRLSLLKRSSNVGIVTTYNAPQDAPLRPVEVLHDVPGLAYNAPEVRLSGLPANVQVTSAPALSFNVHATDERELITRLFVNVNGVPLYGKNGLPVTQRKEGDVTIPVTIPLSVGRNTITVSVLNASGVESLREYLTIRRLGQAQRPDAYIVTIGSGQFRDTSNNLSYPGKDARDVAELFQRSGQFGKVQTQVLTGEQVTRPNILKIKAALKRSKPDDFVILFYAGHGLVAQQQFYLSTYSTDFNQPARTALAFEELDQLLDSIPSRNKLLLIDACHSGEIDQESTMSTLPGRTTHGKKTFRGGDSVSFNGSQLPFQMMNILFADMRRTNGASVIAACGSSQRAFEAGAWNNGAFTYCLLTGLRDKKADADGNGKITVSELVEHLRTSVPLITSGLQQPTTRTENIVNDFIIW